ncbi:uncharacterized protein [Nicotiana sylvestris]|uniref:uncharacterized protein n=1 Tax=Nicotiana sylvestris TaxID=4096 RepID=UPI00388C9373
MDRVVVPKTRADCTAEDLKKWEKNAKAKKWLVCGLGLDEYSIIQSCTTAKEIWDTLQVAHEGTPQVKRSRGILLYSQYENFTMKEGETIQEMYTRFTTLTNELKSLRRIIIEEDKVEKILTRVLLVSWESKITVIQESKNIATFRLDELIGNLTAYELRRQTMKMDTPKKERSLALRIAEGSDLEDDEMAMITREFKKYLMRGKGSSKGTTFNKSRAPKKQTNVGCYKCGKTDHMIKNCPQWEIEWKKERAERRNRKKEQVQPKKNKGSTKAMVAVWGEISYEDSEDEAEEEQALMAIGESNDEQEVQVKRRIQIWYMDSGCSKHMTGNKDQFLSLEDLKGGNISFGNGKKCVIIGVGKEHKDEAIGLVKELTESPTQVKVASKEGTCPSNQSNLTGGTNQGEIESNLLEELVHEPVPQQ